MVLQNYPSDAFSDWAAPKLVVLSDAVRRDTESGAPIPGQFGQVLLDIMSEYDDQPFAQPDFASNLDHDGTARFTSAYLRTCAVAFFRENAHRLVHPNAGSSPRADEARDSDQPTAGRLADLRRSIEKRIKQSTSSHLLLAASGFYASDGKDDPAQERCFVQVDIYMAPVKTPESVTTSAALAHMLAGIKRLYRNSRNEGMSDGRRIDGMPGFLCRHPPKAPNGTTP
ncbi:hypothetical protein AURDEDRAFT_130017 [Auricularia subglabra TFB-10046 SS5]|uniref:Uncharacterized protein n=1 Tax=Auricularia subglabra (strain TFB-10046 / SS5) TaxID=717982 RepID=J0WT52_AURST|nr:hypothetical protein AURDEDRAFT_130017 [Auricularia subglabra TFB-10046 SS5]